ncbi:anti-sigma-F factor Fin family protein [Virgibacillus sp. 179-BFC.A HS]|uniref:Anti-sigma-F factor Fin family protein n=1 Tax=Tigheibacillus jepli TaxID=3035914 RepID=A0ABU5CCP9_9BACI|nr:anti-sigma-F factor Fin family protein [Virgibacillus sp. 179-BFC.A HS]MDY0404041.1 anti-sigma-F factor Fin family protein [Virgibacillus sp. 179-BFC.A HS]
MSIVYKCKHCNKVIGKLEQHSVDISLLGWDNLSPADKGAMIHQQENGDIHIQTICEPCQEALIKNPHYHELDYFIQ